MLGRTRLHSAPNWTVAERLIAQDAEVNAKDKYGITPLHRAAAHTSRDVTELLVSQGADTNTKDDNGRTALWHAQ